MIPTHEDPEKYRLNKWFWILIIIILSIIILIQAARDSFAKSELTIVGIILIVTISLMAIIWFLPIRYVRSLQDKDAGNLNSEFEQEKERLKLEDSTRKTFAQIIGGGIFLFGLLFTYNTFVLNREGQITDRFSKAAELLGNEDIEVRLGGLYALERIAKDSPKDHWAIMEILCAYIREKSPNKKLQAAGNRVTNTNQNTASAAKPVENEPLKTDVKAALTIILRRVAKQDPEKGRLDLSRSNLKGVDLKGANIDMADLSKAQLNYTDLSGNADLSGVDLSGAEITNADLTGANLSGTILISADLSWTHIEEAQLISTKLVRAVLFGTRFDRAKLHGTDFTEANLNGAILGNSTLLNAIFRSANLTGVDLTFEKLRDSQCEINKETELPLPIKGQKDALLDIQTKRWEKERAEEAEKKILK